MTSLVGGLRRLARIGAAVGLAIAGLVPAVAGAQEQATLTGRVLDDGGTPIDGATIFVPELNAGTLTNAQGRYTLVIPAARARGQEVTVTARYIGYTAESKKVVLRGGSIETNFELRQDFTRLNQVVVTGVTGATEQRKLPFAIAQVTEKDMPVPGTNPLSQLQGKVPGANITSTSGRPGAAPAVLLRAPTSINASGRGQDPLYIVDGVILNGTLADLNALDIESIEVVKGAAASSLYGSRAGNGVISITTRSGRSGGEGVKFNVRTEYGAADIERRFPLAQNHFIQMNEDKTRFCVNVTGQPSCSRTVDIYAEALRVNQNGGDFALQPKAFGNDGSIAVAPTKSVLRGQFQTEAWPTQNDPIDQLVSAGQFVQANVDMNGRFGNTNFFASAQQYREEGAFRFLDGYTRQSLRLNVDQRIGNDWTVTARSFYSRNRDNGGGLDGGNGFFRITRIPAYVDPLRRDDRGRLFVRSNVLAQGAGNSNPAELFNSQTSINEGDRYLGSVTVRYTPFTWLETDLQGGYDRSNFSSLFLEDKGFRTTGPSALNLGFIERNSGYTQSYNTSWNATARQNVGDWMNLRYTARALYEQQDFSNLSSSGSNLTVPGLSTTNATIDNRTIGSNISSIRQIGIFAGVAADIKDRYIIDGLIRRDASSLFGAGNRWQTYGRGAFAWRVSEESFWFLPVVSDFKLRTSVGTAGGRPNFAAQYETFSIGAGGVLTPATLGNRDLGPEVTLETEYGIDAEIANRVGIQVTYARAITRDQILPTPASAASGFVNQWRNAGTMDGRTWEAAINVPVITRSDLNYSFRVQWDRVRATITRLDVPEFFTGVPLQAADGIFKFAEGERYGTLYGRKFITECGDLPGDFQSRCGAGREWQANDEGYIVWTGGRDIGDGITNNLWQSANPASASPWGVENSWGMPILLRNESGAGESVALGNTLPNYRWATAHTFNYKRFTAYGLIDAAVGGRIWNQGLHWSYGDFMTQEQDMRNASLESAKPLGYWWRAGPPDNGAGVGGFYDFLQPNSRTVLDASYAKLREVTVGYRLGSIAGVGDWTVSLVGRNLYTWTKYKGFDPEVGIPGGQNVQGPTGSSIINGVDRYGFPNLRRFTFQLGSSF